MIKKEINPVLASLSERIRPEHSLLDVLHRQATDICKEFNFFEDVKKSSLFYFELHFEFWGRTKETGPIKIEIDPLVKRLYAFYVENMEETFRSDESQIAYFLFLEIAKRHPVLSEIIEMKKESLQNIND